MMPTLRENGLTITTAVGRLAIHFPGHQESQMVMSVRTALFFNLPLAYLTMLVKTFDRMHVCVKGLLRLMLD